jgi:hypothetical protein
VSKLAYALRKACLAPACLRQAVKVNFDTPPLCLCDDGVGLLQFSACLLEKHACFCHSSTGFSQNTAYFQKISVSFTEKQACF